MANIGKVNVQLSVDPAGTKTGIQAAIGDLQKFESKVKSIGSGSSILGGALGAIPQISGGLQGTALAGAAITGTLAMIDRGAKQILALSNSANRLGVSMRDVAAMEVLFGDRAESAFTAIDHLNKGMGALRAGNGGDFQGALKSLGLDDKALSGMGTTEAARAITSRIGGLSNSFDKANATAKIFGKSSVEIGELLQRLGTNFDAAAQKADRFGLVPSEEAAQNIRMLKRSAGDVKLAFQGLETQLAATASTPLRAVGDTFAAFMNSIRNQVKLYSGGQGLDAFNRNEVNIWTNAYNSSAKDAAANAEFQDAAQHSLADAVQKTTENWNRQFEALGQGAHIAQTFGAAQQFLSAGMAPEKVQELIGPMQEYARLLDQIDSIRNAPSGGRDIFQDADRKIAALMSLAADTGFDPVALKRIEDALQGIHDQLNRTAEAARSTLGQEMQTPAEKLSARLEYLKNLFRGVADSAELMARATRSAQEGFLQGMGVQAKTPFETFQENAKQLLQMQSTLSPDLFARGMTGIYDNLLKSSGMGSDSKLPSMALYGSQEAYSTINRTNMRGEGLNSPTEVLQQMRADQAAGRQEARRLLEGILDALRNQAVCDL